ncbi:MAG: Crp/Fnr family transcriptional regulator [Candidatus Sericytochromatia bacterium]
MDFEQDYIQALRALFPHYGQTLPAGTRFIQEGDSSTNVYFMITGLAAVFLGDDPNEHMLWLIEAGDFVGELALLDNLPRSASVETLEESHVLILDRDTFCRLLSDYPALAIKVIRTMGMRMRKLDARYKMRLGYDPSHLQYVVAEGEWLDSGALNPTLQKSI